MKKLFLAILTFISTQAMAQTLEKMQWFNEPENWEITDNTLSMSVTPHSDYWRISHYGFTVDDAPFYYTTYGGEFEVKVKITGDYKVRFDQAGLMLRIDKENYIKTGIEFVDGKFNLSTGRYSPYKRLECHYPRQACTLHLDKGSQTTGCRRGFLFLRRQDLRDDAKCMAARQHPSSGWSDGSLSRR